MEIDIERIIGLSRVNLAPGEKIFFKNQMEEIIHWVEEINAISETGQDVAIEVPATPLRTDDLEPESLEKGTALMNAPEEDGDFFIVSEVIKKR